MARKSREQAELEAYLRFKRMWEKKQGDIEWYYEEFLPLVDRYKAGELKLNKKLELE